MGSEPPPRLDIRLLGDLTVQVDGVVVAIAGRQQQALLTLLALRANHVVRHEQLIEALWGPTPPSTAEAGLRVSISKLRRALDHDGSSPVVTEQGGYRLRVAAQQTDLGRFRSLISEARGVAEPAARGRLLTEALSEWRGPPMDGVVYDAVANGELKRLEELHDLAVGDRIDCDLALGRHRELVPELEALVAAAPLQERPHEQLMRALSRSGRQSESLELYRRFRTRLVDELGLEPSPELRELEHSILAQDEVAVSEPPKIVTARKRRQPSKVLLALGGAVAIVVVGVLISIARRDPEASERPPLGNVARLNEQTGAVIDQLPIQASIDVGDGFGRILVGDEATGGDWAWVLNTIDLTINRIDQASNRVTATFDIEGDVEDFALADGDLWITDPAQNTLDRIDAETGETTVILPVGLLPIGVIEAEGDIWVANHRGRPSGSVWRVDPETNSVVARIPVGAREFRSGPQWLAAGAGSVWVGVPNLNAVVRIDPSTNLVEATIPVPDGGVCGQLFADDTSIWAASGLCGDGMLTRIDPRTNEVVARIKSPGWTTVFGGTLGFGSVWITTDGGPFEVDPTTNSVVSRLALKGDSAFGGNLASGHDSLWIHDAEDQAVLRIDPGVGN